MLQDLADDRDFPERFFIGSAPGNYVTSLTTYTTHTRASGHNKKIKKYIYSSNPWESNHRDGPTGHKNNNDYICVCIYILYYPSLCVGFSEATTTYYPTNRGHYEAVTVVGNDIEIALQGNRDENQYDDIETSGYAAEDAFMEEVLYS